MSTIFELIDASDHVVGLYHDDRQIGFARAVDCDAAGFVYLADVYVLEEFQGRGLGTALLAQATSWQVPGLPEGASRMLNTAPPDASAMLARMKSRRPSSQMPPLGTNMRDEVAIAAVTSWLEAPARSGRR